MATIIEEPNIRVSPDDWLLGAKVARPTNLREEIEILMQQYLAAGGQVQEVTTTAPRASAEPAPFNYDRLSGIQDQAVVSRRKRKLTERDHADAKHLEQLLAEGVPRRGIAKALGCSDWRLQRLLRLFFADDPRADSMRAGDMADRKQAAELRQVERIKRVLAQGVQGISAVANAANVNHRSIHDLNRRYKLGIQALPRGGRRAKD